MNKIIAIVLLAFTAATAHAQLQLMTPEKLANCRASLPKIESEEWAALTADPTTLFYSDVEIPAAYQHADSGLVVVGRGIGVSRQTTLHSPKYNISGDPTDNHLPHGLGGNGNVDFPWRVPGGLDAAEADTTSFKLLWLPKQDDGRPWPVVVYNDVLYGSGDGPHSGYRWIFPRNAILGEALAIRDSRGSLHVFELRTRIRQEGYWDVDILRPFPSRDSFVKRLQEVDPQSATKMTKQPALTVGRLVDRHRRRAFASAALSETLPPLPESTVIELLDETPFKSALGDPWATHGGGIAFAPQSAQRFSIVPAGYTGTFLGGTHAHCAKCHEHTLKHVDQFDEPRGWYGYIRGSDGIFTFHPFDPRTISYNGGTIQTQYRRSLFDAGIVAAYDPNKHPNSRYSTLKETP